MYIVGSSLLVVLASILATPVASAGVMDFPAPTPILETEGLAEGVDPGDIFATLEDVALFWLDELDHRGTPKDRFDDAFRLKLWRTDGTRSGTFPLLPPNASFFGSAPPFQGLIYFVVCKAEEPIELFTSAVYLCDKPFDLELWRTDGSREGTFRLTEEGGVKLFWSQRSSLWPAPELGMLFFLGYTDKGDPELWRTDGTRGGTSRVRALSSLGLEGAGGVVGHGGEVYFIGWKATDDAVWIGRSDGTAAGTSLFRAPNDGKVQVANLLPSGGRLFLLAEPREVFEPGESYGRTTVWILSEGAETFHQVGTLGSSNPRKTDLRVVGVEGRLFFSVLGSSIELWSTDGTAAPEQIVGKMPDYSDAGLFWPEPYHLADGRILIRAFEHDHGTEPWVSDGTFSGTVRLADLCPGECSSLPAGLGNFNGSYLFAADDGRSGSELWRWLPAADDPGTVELVADLCPGNCSSWPSIVARAGERLFLRASDEAGMRHLWTVHPDGPGLLRLPKPPDRYLGGYEFIFNRHVSRAQVVGGRLVFWATGQSGSPELWVLELPPDPPPPPPGPALTAEELPGFGVKVKITAGPGASAPGRAEPNCLAETLCVSGAVAGRSEVFVRVVGPKPNGKLWPILVKFTTSTVEVWIEQLSTGFVRYYRLEGAGPGSSQLPGLFDRTGFDP